MEDQVLQNPAQLGDILVKLVGDRRFCSTRVGKRLLPALAKLQPSRQLTFPNVRKTSPIAWARR